MPRRISGLGNHFCLRWEDALKQEEGKDGTSIDIANNAIYPKYIICHPSNSERVIRVWLNMIEEKTAIFMVNRLLFLNRRIAGTMFPINNNVITYPPAKLGAKYGGLKKRTKASAIVTAGAAERSAIAVRI